ncbi:MAG: phosphatidylserine/phosphatidylglycerophosphate/cardiolipin synthase family protein [Deltaproteobacteria bacterium]|jgi:phosphatidylserine/phosphatidylglycerophosphate/cardiolipin synthase-like enzyme|nr:phosphatidylserine/phosphatidylglycerophosphate/cardiolipin synthase family protein [Deltaproteobacteria bacterium]MBT6435369.1 phosphatidylserine/phosphatidylglycerophosphate/cardiolipin synthase family protein [Deltaproteobacteria bacterium]
MIRFIDSIKKCVTPMAITFSLVAAPALVFASSAAPEKAPPAETSYRADGCSDFYGAEFQNELDDVTGSVEIDGNEVILSQFAAENLALRQQMMGDSEKFIFLYTLLLEPNEATTDQIVTMIERANPPVDARGTPTRDAVEVDVVYNEIAQVLSGDLFSGEGLAPVTLMRNAGVNAIGYWARNYSNPFEFLVSGSHKKSLIVDSSEYGAEALVGGRNIGDAYQGVLENAQAGDYPDLWKDTDILIRGAAVHTITEDFIKRFNIQSDVYEIPCNQHRSSCPQYYPAVSKENPNTNMALRVVENEPDDNNGEGFYGINALFDKMLKKAGRSIDIQTPYFIPQEPLLNELYAALDAGVRVRILTNSRDANDLGSPLFYASAYYFDELLERGAEIYLWDVEKKSSPIARTMHSKTLVVDSCVFAAGSFNLDGRAYNWENEYFFPVFDEGFGQVGQNMFDSDLAVNGVFPISTQWMDNTFSWYERVMMQALALGSSLL